MKKILVLTIISLFILGTVSLFADEAKADAKKDVEKKEADKNADKDVKMDKPKKEDPAPVDKDFAIFALVGGNFGTLAGGVDEYYDPNLGFKIGGGVELKLLDGLFLNAGLEFALAQGGKFSYENNSAAGLRKVEGTQSLYYVNVPILGKFKSKKGLFLAVGPYFGFLMSAEREVSVKVNGTPVDAKNAGERDGGNADDFKSIDIGAKIGLGYSIALGGGNKATVGLYYQQGFFDINELKTGSMINRAFAIDLGIFLF